MPVDMVRVGNKYISVHASGPTWTQALPGACLLPGMLGLPQRRHTGVCGRMCGPRRKNLFCRRMLKPLGLFFLLPVWEGHRCPPPRQDACTMALPGCLPQRVGEEGAVKGAFNSQSFQQTPLFLP